MYVKHNKHSRHPLILFRDQSYCCKTGIDCTITSMHAFAMAAWKLGGSKLSTISTCKRKSMRLIHIPWQHMENEPDESTHNKIRLKKNHVTVFKYTRGQA